MSMGDIRLMAPYEELETALRLNAAERKLIKKLMRIQRPEAFTRKPKDADGGESPDEGATNGDGSADDTAADYATNPPTADETPDAPGPMANGSAPNAATLPRANVKARGKSGPTLPT